MDEFPSSSGQATPLEELVSGAVTALTFLVAFGLLFADVSWFWVAFPVGFAGVLPMALALVKQYQRTHETPDHSTETDAALDALRERYARGELSDAEFEDRVEQLLDTESVEDARTALDRDRSPTDERERA